MTGPTSATHLATNLNDTKDSYGDTDRLDPEEARQFVKDVTTAMQQYCWNKNKRHRESEGEPLFERGEDEPSMQKQYFGKSCSLLWGIRQGMHLMERARDKEMDLEEGQIDHGIEGDEEWQEHYDEYGYGVYGRGLTIGKKLAFYEERDFTFSHESGSESEPNFTITSYDE